VAVHLEYDAFGKVVKSTGTVGNFRYRFSTKPQVDEIGWLYYGFRYCAPSEAWRLLRGESPRRKGPEGGSLMSQELAARFVSSLAGVKEGRKQPNNTTEA